LAKFGIYADEGGHHRWGSSHQRPNDSKLRRVFASKSNARAAAEHVDESASTAEIVEE
jgi:uncharacterized protein YegP (UPF0339 family)